MRMFARKQLPILLFVIVLSASIIPISPYATAATVRSYAPHFNIYFKVGDVIRTVYSGGGATLAYLVIKR